MDHLAEANYHHPNDGVQAPHKNVSVPIPSILFIHEVEILNKRATVDLLTQQEVRQIRGMDGRHMSLQQLLACARIVTSGHWCSKAGTRGEKNMLFSIYHARSAFASETRWCRLPNATCFHVTHAAVSPHDPGLNLAPAKS